MKQFILFSGTFSPYGRNRTKMALIWKDTFKLKESDFIDVDYINKLSLEQMKRFCRAIEAPHGVVTNGSESVFVKPGERHKWESKHDYEEDDSDRFEEEEDELRVVTGYDNMLQHLSAEEREEYLREKRAEKEKFGSKYDGDSIDFSKLSESQRILFQLSWRLEDVPEQYQASILKGRIPAEFRDEFLGALPESILQEYKKYFKRDRVPKALLKALVAARKDAYLDKMKEKIKNEDQEDNDEFEGDNDIEEEKRPEVKDNTRIEL